RVRHLRWQQQHLPGADRQIHGAALLPGPQHHVAFQLIEELLAGVDVVVLTRIRAADHHDDEVAVAKHTLVADRWAQLRAVRIDPLAQVECLQGLHVASVPPYGTPGETRSSWDATQTSWCPAALSGPDDHPRRRRVLAPALALAQAAACRAAGGP